VLLLSALISACAVFAPLYERALEQSLLRDGLTRQNAVATSIVGESVQADRVPPEPAVVRGTFPPGAHLRARSCEPGPRARPAARPGQPRCRGRHATHDPEAAAVCDGEVQLDEGRLTRIR
jgi:hypothetical protein